MSHLALDLEFADLHKLFGAQTKADQPRILGALLVSHETVLIDGRLDPERHPSRYGQYRFTLGHEIGHWCLHRKSAVDARVRYPILPGRLNTAIVCRSGPKKERMEWQADYFSACLLMPRDQVYDDAEFLYGCSDEPLPYWDQCENGEVRVRAKRLMRIHGRSEKQANSEAKRDIAIRPLARRFGVSLPAMRVRSEELGILPADYACFT